MSMLYPVVAQRDAWESLGNRFTGDQIIFHWGDLGSMAGILVTAVLFIMLLRWLHLRQESRRMSNEPWHLFVDLCHAHQLSRRERRLLLEISDAANLENPADVFLRPELFNRAHLQSAKPRDQRAFERLKFKLFDGLDKLQPGDFIGGTRSNVKIFLPADMATGVPPEVTVTFGEPDDDEH
ncbi:hypothetical protein [Aeoliella mucimassa]|uniref:Uncharacterized protein n=1 Tax=Aeoliella mucimassa TaxID=2527972 RepID=A0A518ANW2_9BACT|nr:hypothetical protein [Aeoliella mucimassa]QDU56407.1 hypothetical protein Pan181_26160 [Aeoliella mucimassa]